MNINDTHTTTLRAGLGFSVVAILSILSCLLIWKYLYVDTNVPSHKTTSYLADEINEPSQTKTSFLINDNDVVCTIETIFLKCEELDTGKSKDYAIPEKYRNASLVPSPDGKKFLVQSSNKDVVVVDLNFREVQKIFNGTELSDRNPSFLWTNTSGSIIISEIKREENDAEFLPEPLVVGIFNLTTGETRRVYKTGERIDVGSISVLGSDDSYLFITYPTPKNWVAGETKPPPVTINAVRLLDGFVLSINSHQANDADVHGMYYDSTKNIFFSTGFRNNEPEKGYIVASELEENEFGLVLRKKFEFDVGPLYSMHAPILTSKGVMLSSNEGEAFQLVQDDGTITATSHVVASNPYSLLLSLHTMPSKIIILIQDIF